MAPTDLLKRGVQVNADRVLPVVPRLPDQTKTPKAPNIPSATERLTWGLVPTDLPPQRQRMRAPIYAQIWNSLGFSGDPPPVYSDPGMPKWYAGVQELNNRKVWIQPYIAQGIKKLWQARGRDWGALNVLLHEYAHVNQPRVNPRDLVEGGAETWSHAMLEDTIRKLGIPAPNRYDKPAWNSYHDFVSKLSRNPYATYLIDRGQFGR